MIRGRRRRGVHPGDVLAGISVAMVLVPQSLAYAELAGLPAHRGLYAGALPPLIAALFASSPYLQTGTTALTSLLTFGALSAVSTPGTDEYVGLAALLALVVGATRLLIGLVRAGPVSYLLSRPVLRGFTAAAAMLIVASQLPSFLGAAPDGDGVLSRAAHAIAAPAGWDPIALGLGVATVVLVLGSGLVHKLFPGVLLAVGAGIIYSTVAGYDGATVGDVPQIWFPPLTLDLPWSQTPSLLVSGVVIALIGFAEVASVSQVYAESERQTWDANREFVSQGAANVAAGLFAALPVGGSFSRSSLNYVAGATSAVSGAVTGLTVLLALPFAGVLEPLPKAILAGVVIAAVIRLLDPRPLVELVRFSLPQSAVGVATFALTLLWSPHVEYAVIAGIGMSLAVHIWREQYFKVVVRVEGHVLTLRPIGVIWFGSAPMFRQSLATAVAQNDHANRLEIDLSRVGRVDLTGALALREVALTAAAAGLPPSFTGVPPNARRILDRVCANIPAAHRDDPTAFEEEE